jgi:hypothetical protein
MTRTKFELEDEVFLYLSTIRETTMSKLMNKFRCKKSNLQDILKQYEKTHSNPLGLIKVRSEKNRKIYSLETTAYDELHDHLETYIDSINDTINFQIKKLEKQKPIFKNVKGTKISKEGFSLSFGLSNKQSKEHLENISLLLSDIIQKSFLITYYKTLNQIPASKIKQSNNDQKLCIKTYSDIIKKLRNVVGRRELHQKALDNYLFRHQMTIRRLDLKP